MNQELHAYIDWLQDRGVKFPVGFSNFANPKRQNQEVSIAEAASGLPRICLFNNAVSSEEDSLMLSRLSLALAKYSSSVEIIDRTSSDFEQQLLIASQAGHKIVLFQLAEADCDWLIKKGGAQNLENQNVLPTARVGVIRSNPHFKRMLWQQIQTFLGFKTDDA